MIKLNRFYWFLGGVLALTVADPTLSHEAALSEAAKTHLERMIAFYQHGNLQGAITELREALVLHPKDPNLHFMLGNALYRHGDLRGASSAYRVTLEHWPHHFEAHMSRGFTLYELAEFEEAAAEWLAAVRLNPKEPFARAGLAIGLYQLGQWEDAKEQYAEALTLDYRYGDLEMLRRDIRWNIQALSVVEQLIDQVQTDRKKN